MQRLSFGTFLVAVAISCHQGSLAFVPASLGTVTRLNNRQAVSPGWQQRQFATIDKDSAGSSNTQDDTKETPVPQPQPTNSFQTKKPASHYDTIIAGGGPTGLLAAIALSQKYGPDHKIAVCEQRSTIPPSPSDDAVWSDVARFYLLGIGHRGQTALEKFGVMDDFKEASVEVKGRRDWQPGKTKVEDGNTTPNKKSPPSRVLPRDKLVGVLHEHLVQNYIDSDKKANIDLLYGYQVDPVDFGADPADLVSVRISKCEDKSSTDKETFKASQESEELCDTDKSVVATTNFLIGADGAARTVANAMEKADTERYNNLNPLQRLVAKRPFRVTKFEDDNPKVYKSVPIQLPADWPLSLNYSARSSDSRVTLEALPSDDKGSLCALLLMKPEDELAQPDVDPSILRAFFDKEFPQFGALVDDDEMARVAQKDSSRLPVFRFAGPRLNMGSRTLVLGDAAHTVKPYYGLGANTALEDVQVLSEILDASSSSSSTGNEDVVPTAVQEFSDRRSADSAALVTISRNMDRPGKLFYINFLLPLILDGMFHKMAPRIFGPNMFGMFQMKGIGFKQIQRKKRFDRALQLTLIGSLLTGAGTAAKSLVLLLARVSGKSPIMVCKSALLAGMLVMVANNLASGDKTAASTA